MASTLTLNGGLLNDNKFPLFNKNSSKNNPKSHLKLIRPPLLKKLGKNCCFKKL